MSEVTDEIGQTLGKTFEVLLSVRRPGEKTYEKAMVDISNHSEIIRLIVPKWRKILGPVG